MNASAPIMSPNGVSEGMGDVTGISGGVSRIGFSGAFWGNLPAFTSPSASSASRFAKS